MINAISNFGGLWPGSLSLFLGDYIDWRYLCTGGIIFAFGYYNWYKKVFDRLEHLTKEE